MNNVDLPLEGVRVLDLTRLLPGAYCTLVLADLGADVVKVENPRGGDPTRSVPPIVDGASVYHHLFNRNKRSVAVDLRSPEAAAIVDALAPRFDVVVHNFRPRVARRLGVDAAALGARHPRLVHATISGFGRSGPYADRAAHDINYEALSGLLAARGGTPHVPQMLVADIAAASHTVGGILAALYRRERTGEGAVVDIALHGTALSLVMFPGARALVDGAASLAGDLAVAGGDACYNLYETADGKHLALGALEEKFWRRFCERLGRPDLAGTQGATGEDQMRVLNEIRAILRTRPRADWLALFADEDVCLTPVNTITEALDDPHVRAGDAVAREGRVTYIRTPITIVEESPGKIDRRRGVPIRPAPALGAHTDEVLTEAGVPSSERARLRQIGVL